MGAEFLADHEQDVVGVRELIDGGAIEQVASDRLDALFLQFLAAAGT